MRKIGKAKYFQLRDSDFVGRKSLEILNMKEQKGKKLVTQIGEEIEKISLQGELGRGKIYEEKGKKIKEAEIEKILRQSRNHFGHNFPKKQQDALTRCIFEDLTFGQTFQ